MLFFDAAAVARKLPYAKLIDALDAAFRGDVTVPARAQHTIPCPGAADATLLFMPAWRAGGAIGAKIASVFPDNASKGKGAVNASYFLLDGETGEPRAVIDGGELTLRRTACASALAARYLSPAGAGSLLMIGTGNLAPHLVGAHASVRDYAQIRVWGRNAEKARAVADVLSSDHGDVRAAEDLEAAVREADVVSSATLSSEPLIRGSWLRPGQHIDLVGAFTPDMREADSEAIRRARIVVDTYEGAFSEAGEIIQALDEQVISKSDLTAELSELARGTRHGRRSSDEITLFKSVGTALEDLAAAELIVSGS